MKSKKSFFDSLIGQWEVSRKLGDKGSANGRATFTLKDENLIFYREDLAIEWNDHTTTLGYREYFYSYENDEIVKYFYDDQGQKGKFFYQLNFVEGNDPLASATYKCENDKYDATYIFWNPNSFWLKYEVTGPGKNYRLESSYTKLLDSTDIIGTLNEGPL